MVQEDHRSQISIYTMQHMATSSADRKLENKITALEHLLVTLLSIETLSSLRIILWCYEVKYLVLQKSLFGSVQRPAIESRLTKELLRDVTFISNS